MIRNRGWAASVSAAVLAILGVLTSSGAYTPMASPAQGPPEVKPTDEHKLLAKDVGVWDGTMKMFMEGPDGPATTSKGVETNTLMVGGLWVVSNYKGEFAGKPFEGSGVNGYDPRKKKFVGTWADSMTPELMLLEGTYDEAAKALTLLSEGTGEDGKPVSMKMVSQYKGEDEKVFTLSVKNEETEGKWMKMMEIGYKRRK